MHAQASPTAADPGRHRRAVDHEVPVAVLDLGHDRHPVVQALALRPVGGERQAAHDGRPALEVGQRPHGAVAGAGDQTHAPRAVVGGQGQHRDRAVGLQQRAQRRRRGAVVGAEVDPVVDEARGPRAPRAGDGRPPPPPNRRARSAGRRRRPRAGRRCPRRRWCAPPGRGARRGRFGPGQQALDGHPAPDGEPRGGLGRRGQHRLHDRSTAGEHLVVGVRGPEPAGQLDGGVGDGVEARRTGVVEGARHVGQLALELDAHAGLEEVQEAELVDPAPLPGVPGLGGSGRWCGVALEDGDLVPVAGEQHGRCQSGDAPTRDHHVGHRSPPLTGAGAPDTRLPATASYQPGRAPGRVPPRAEAGDPARVWDDRTRSRWREEDGGQHARTPHDRGLPRACRPRPRRRPRGGGRRARGAGLARRDHLLRDVRTRARGMALALDAMGVGPGERVAIVSPNSGRFLVSFFGVSGFGRVLVPVNYRLNAEEVGYIVEHSGASVLLVDPELDGDAGRRVGQGAHAPRRRRGRRAVRPGAAGGDPGGVGGRRGRHLLDQLHVGDHGAAQGRAAHPPQLLAERGDVRLAHHRHRPRRPAPHPADVPLQRVGHALRGHRHGRQARRAAQGRRRGHPGARRARRGSPCCAPPPPWWPPCSGRPRSAAPGARRCPGAGTCASSWPVRPRRRRPSSASRPSSGGSSSRSTASPRPRRCSPSTGHRPSGTGSSPRARAALLSRAGVPAVGVRLRIDDDGEVLARANHVFGGYWEQPAETDDALGGGWFHTGDGGYLDGAPPRHRRPQEGRHHHRRGERVVDRGGGLPLPARRRWPRWR